jgi:hypothetical protein
MGEKIMGNISFTALLCVAFVILRLCGVIDWPWLWVVSPIWLSVACGVLVLPFYIYYHWKQERRHIEKERMQRKSKWQERLEQIKNKRS